MKISGNIKKMSVEHTAPIHYTLHVGDASVDMNALIGSGLKIEWNRQINCMKCGVSTVKSFAQGYCYTCLRIAPETAPCILNPELCEAHLGIARDLAWAEENCLTEHFVYLAVSGNIKVGITRLSQVPTRWIDQGATAAVKLASVPNRYTSGVVEVELKKHFSDKTSWQQMLKNAKFSGDLLAEKKRAIDLLPLPLKQYVIENSEIYTFEYPVIYYPEKVTSIDLDKLMKFEGKLTGIKGQYLMFEGGHVINMRKYGGYFLTLSF